MKRFGIALLAFASAVAVAAPAPTVAEARKFIEDAEAKLLVLAVESNRADWVRSTYITYDTEILAAKADEKSIAATEGTIRYEKTSRTPAIATEDVTTKPNDV